MTERQEAIDFLLREAEEKAIREQIPFMKAAKAVVRDKGYLEHILLACGGFWKAKPPSDRQIRAWRDPVKVQLAKKYPNITDEQTQLVLAHIPVSKRPMDGKVRQSRELARKLRKSGASVDEVAEALDVSRTAAYRLIGPSRTYDTSTDWHDQAIELRNQGSTYRDIADQLGKNYQRVQRFFARRNATA